MERHGKYCASLTLLPSPLLRCQEFQGQSRERADLLGQEASLLKYYAETFDLQVGLRLRGEKGSCNAATL
jgi:hypothetical protein